MLKKYFEYPALNKIELEKVYKKIQDELGLSINDINLDSEYCYYVHTSSNEISEDEVMTKILKCPFNTNQISSVSSLEISVDQKDSFLIEIGSRLSFCTAFSTNAVSICHSSGLITVKRIERSIRYLITIKQPIKSEIDIQIINNNLDLSSNGDHKDINIISTKKEKMLNLDTHSIELLRKKLISILHDKMTECCYEHPLTSFNNIHMTPQPVYTVDIMRRGRHALEEAGHELGLSFDSWDLDYYTDLFLNRLERNPTNVECFDLAQSNSEHCRHWYFKGKFIIDGVEKEHSLLQIVMNTQIYSNPNNVIKFHDNSSAIKGYSICSIIPKEVTGASEYVITSELLRHPVFTAETHNFPTGVAPFPGATTGTGGRIRDVQATGRGSHVIAGTVGYCVGSLNIPGYKLPWENTDEIYPSNLSNPLTILIEGSNGASDYGNKFGEPLITGFCRSFGIKSFCGERREWIKPIMFTGGVGSVEDNHVNKFNPETDMLVVKVGGPALRIGLGGGCASSISIQDKCREELDFNAVQRGDAEMEQKMNRVIRACIEMGIENPICSIHDQGAGGNGNVLKELCYPNGAIINLSGFLLGDPTLSVVEIWAAEYQENNAMLIKSKDIETVKQIAKREKCPLSVVGCITNDNKIRLEDDRQIKEDFEPESKKSKLPIHKYPIDLDLELVLGEVNRKVFDVKSVERNLEGLVLPYNLSIMEALDRVLRLPSVGSKRFLTNKVDRSVTGLIAQQQCVGPLHTPLADVAVVSLSHFTTKGVATSIGEQPMKLLIDPAAGARMCVAEALNNLVFALVSDLKDVKCSANWMWPAKQSGEDALLYAACSSMCQLMAKLGIAVDGGKDSLSMAVQVQDGSIVKSPGNLVISTYAACPDITATITPDLKCPNGRGNILYLPHNSNKYRLGGSALGQCYNSLGDSCPDVDDPDLFNKTFRVTQKLIEQKYLCSGHDVSDGGLITSILEMAFAGNCGLNINLSTPDNVSTLEYLFAEELALVFEVEESKLTHVEKHLKDADIKFLNIGFSTSENSHIFVEVNNILVIDSTTSQLRSIWEHTGYELEKLQSNPKCAEQEYKSLQTRIAPQLYLSFDPDKLMSQTLLKGLASNKPRVAVIREEGSNGDREMSFSLYSVGFETWDVNMQDLINEKVDLSLFRGLVFVGGFSYADVFGSAKGWAAVIKYNETVRCQFEKFYHRTDTFSLGVCNGCQLMAHLGWVGTNLDDKENKMEQGVLLKMNESGRFESRFVNIKIEESPSIMLKGMQGSVLGVWIAHGEGRVSFRDDSVINLVNSEKLITMRYADNNGSPTMDYPYNPNGSQLAVAGLCSQDGRHLAIMPHPERCTIMWQWPWVPQQWKEMNLKNSPWACIFKNAYDWCLSN